MTEDLSTYSESDPNNHISATSSRITGTNINRNETAYSYYDKGTGYFDALDIDFDIKYTNLDANDIIGVFGISNTLNHIGAFGTNDIKVVYYYPSGGSRGLYLVANSTDTLAYTAVSETYFCTLERASGSATVNLKVYTDAGRAAGALLDTMSVTLATASTKHRYIFGVASQNTGNDYAASGYVENVLINSTGGVNLFGPALVGPSRYFKGRLI